MSCALRLVTPLIASPPIDSHQSNVPISSHLYTHSTLLSPAREHCSECQPTSAHRLRHTGERDLRLGLRLHRSRVRQRAEALGVVPCRTGLQSSVQPMPGHARHSGVLHPRAEVSPTITPTPLLPTHPFPLASTAQSSPSTAGWHPMGSTPLMAPTGEVPAPHSTSSAVWAVATMTSAPPGRCSLPPSADATTSPASRTNVSHHTIVSPAVEEGGSFVVPVGLSRW